MIYFHMSLNHYHNKFSEHPSSHIETTFNGSSLVAWWLGLWAFTARAWVLSLVGERPKSHMVLQKKKKMKTGRKKERNNIKQIEKYFFLLKITAGFPT